MEIYAENMHQNLVADLYLILVTFQVPKYFQKFSFFSVIHQLSSLML